MLWQVPQVPRTYAASLEVPGSLMGWCTVVPELTTEEWETLESLRPLRPLQNSPMLMLSMTAKSFLFVNGNIFILTSQ